MKATCPINVYLFLFTNVTQSSIPCFMLPYEHSHAEASAAGGFAPFVQESGIHHNVHHLSKPSVQTLLVRSIPLVTNNRETALKALKRR
jgi:hypothetical protein